MTKAARKDPRINMVVKIMQRTRFERLEKMLDVKDMRRKNGRVTMADEARKIIAALDEYDAQAFDAAFQAELSKAGASK